MYYITWECLLLIQLYLPVLHPPPHNSIKMMFKDHCCFDLCLTCCHDNCMIRVDSCKDIMMEYQKIQSVQDRSENTDLLYASFYWLKFGLRAFSCPTWNMLFSRYCDRRSWQTFSGRILLWTESIIIIRLFKK